jgi:hypothetical protein
MELWSKIKSHGIVLLISLSIALNLLLGVLLIRVNSDLDKFYKIVDKQGIGISQVMTNQKYMISNRETQRILDQQSAACQGQINELNGAINGAYYQMYQNQQKAWDAARLRQMEAGIKYNR